MDDAAREKLESEARRQCEAGNHDAAITLALKGYGPEIFGFLMALHKSEGEAGDVFSHFSENMWRGLAGFSWECTLRAWAYTIARNASHRYRKQGRRHAEGRVAIDGEDASRIGELVQKVRTETLTYLKTEQKDKFAALRETLSPEDQELLILRVDRKLAWDELARVMNEQSESSADDLKKESARLRKRFQLVKEKLTKLGEAAGLIPKK